MACALALSGCATVPPPAPALDTASTPAAWVNAPPSTQSTNRTAPDDLSRWWLRLGDAQLVALVDRALRSNTGIESARAALQQSRALRDASAAGLAPTLDGSASAQRNRANSGTGNSFRAGFDASWEPDVFGATRAAVGARDADTTATAARLEDAQVSVAAEVALDFLQLRGSQARLAIARANLDSQRDTLQIAQWRATAGLATTLDVEQARAAAAQTQAQLPALEFAASKAAHALAVLVGESPGSLNATLAAPSAQPQAPDDLALAFPADTLRQRPDVRAAEAAVQAASLRVTQADAARYPSFHLGGSLGLSALTLGSLTSGSSLVASLLGSVSLPLLDGGANAANLRAQQAVLAQAQAGYRAAVLAASRDVEDALVSLAADRQRADALQVAAQSAADAALLATQRYQSGLIDFQTVLETQRTQLAAQDSVATIRTDIASDHVRLYKALGGGWQATLPESAELRTEPAPKTP